MGNTSLHAYVVGVTCLAMIRTQHGLSTPFELVDLISKNSLPSEQVAELSEIVLGAIRVLRLN